MDINCDIEHIQISKSHFKLFSDSLSCLQSLHSMNIDHSSWIYCTVIIMFPIKVTLSTSAGFHIGIHGNKAAKSALDFVILKFTIPSTDFKHFIKLCINSLWGCFETFGHTS